MNPIIPAYLIYLLGIVGNIRSFILAIAVVACIFTVIGIFGYFIESDMGGSPWVEIWKQVLKKCVPIAVITLFLFSMIPTRQTLILMVATKFVTKNNMTVVLDATGNIKEDLKTDLIDIINALKGSVPEIPAVKVEAKVETKER